MATEAEVTAKEPELLLLTLERELASADNFDFGLFGSSIGATSVSVCDETSECAREGVGECAGGGAGEDTS